MKKCIALLLTLTLTMALTLALPVSAADAAVSTTAAAENIAKYGNVMLDVTCDDFKAAGFAYGDVVTVEFLDQTLELPFVSNYSDVDSGSPAILARAADTNVLAAINMGDFATTYGVAVKSTAEDGTVSWAYANDEPQPVAFVITLKEAGGYYDEYVMHQLSYTNERADYPGLTDEQFANFRNVATTGMGENILYRTSSPVNPENNRNAYADAALKALGAENVVVMNLADDEETARGYEGYADSYYSTIKYIALNMGVDFAAADFQAKLAQGLRFFAANPGSVYVVHCTEGKDRAGFVSAVLEALTGASYDEIVADYMTTYYNYYGVTKDEARYDVIANSNIVKSLQRAFGGDGGETPDLTAIDLSAAAERYVKGIGLSDAEVAALKANLKADRVPDMAKPIEPETPAPVEPEPRPEPETPVIVPAPAEESAADGTTYVVAAGDCLWNLAYRYYGTGAAFGRIAAANGIGDPYVVYVGQTLTIPAK